MSFLFSSCLPSSRRTQSGLVIVMIIGVVYFSVELLSSHSAFLLRQWQSHAIYWQNSVVIRHIQTSTFIHSKYTNNHKGAQNNIQRNSTLVQVHSPTPFVFRSKKYSNFGMNLLSSNFNHNQTLGRSFYDAITEQQKGDEGNPLQAEQQGFIFPELNTSSLKSVDLTRVGQLNLLYFDTSKTVSGTGSVRYYSPMQKAEGNSTKEAMKVEETPSSSGNDLLMAFQPLINRDERLLMLYTFQQFIHVCDFNNLTYFLYGGALLGAYRHHDIIPWDDDIDVMMAARQRSQIKRLLSSMAGFGLSAPMGRQWKFYWKGAPTLQLRDYRWPYIDIFFFDTNGTHLFDDSRQYRASFRYPLSHVFPLQLRPFAGVLLPVPCNMPAVLRVNYFPWLCVTSSYLHKLESPAPRHLEARAACSRLFSQFPFVFRQRVDPSSVLEMVIQDGVVISKTSMPPFCGQQTPLNSV